MMVAEHKTGYLQSASIFLYPHVYRAMKIFITIVLPKLSPFFGNENLLHPKLPIFMDFKGRKIHTSMVTPIIRKGLSNLGIHFRGTVTDLRRAAATLTGNYSPQLSERMSQLMGHSRKTHDKVYRVQLGHSGLLEAFKELEVLQSNPFTSGSNTSFAFCSENCDISSLQDSTRLVGVDSVVSIGDEDPLMDTTCLSIDCQSDVDNVDMNSTNLEEVDCVMLNLSNSDNDSPSGRVYGAGAIHSLVQNFNHDVQDLRQFPISNSSPLNSESTSSSVSVCTTSDVPHDFRIERGLECEISSGSIDKASCILSSKTNFGSGDQATHIPQFCDFSSANYEKNTLDEAETYSTSISNSLPLVCPNSNSLCSSLSNKPYNSNTDPIIKDCSVIIRLLNITSLKRKRYDEIPSSKRQNCYSVISHQYKSIFCSKYEEQLFTEVFGDLILRVTDHSTISKVEVINRAKSSIRFKPVLHNLEKNINTTSFRSSTIESELLG